MVRGTERSPPPKKQPWLPQVFLLVTGLLLLVVATSAAVAMLVGSLIFAIRLVYQCARQSAQEQRRGPSSETCGWRLQLCLLHLWLWVTALGLPAAIVWFSVGPLSPRPGGADPLAPTATFLILAQAVLWQPFVPNPQGLYYRPVAWLFRLLSCACVLLSPVRMYRAAQIIAVAHMALALQQLLSPQQLGHKAD